MRGPADPAVALGNVGVAHAAVVQDAAGHRPTGLQQLFRRSWTQKTHSSGSSRASETAAAPSASTSASNVSMMNLHDAHK